MVQTYRDFLRRGMMKEAADTKDNMPGITAADPAASLPAEGFMTIFPNEFVRRNTFTRGGRHDFMLKLGRTIRYKGFSLSEFELIKQMAASRFSESDYPVGECEIEPEEWVKECPCYFSFSSGSLPQ